MNEPVLAFYSPHSFFNIWVVGVFSLWILYSTVRDLKKGSIVCGKKYERKDQPFWYWFYTFLLISVSTGSIIFCTYIAFTKL